MPDQGVGQTVEGVPTSSDRTTSVVPEEVLASTGPVSPGARIGRYVVLRELGSGGMSVVYVAYDPELDRQVALKLMRPGRRGTARSQGRLLREAQALARLSHPNVV